MNCDVKKCKAECCGLVPFNKTEFDKSKLIREVNIQEKNGIIIAVDKDLYCGFLGHDYKCAIYDHRPDICRRFGNEEHALLTCRWQNKNGEIRSRAERRRSFREMKTVTDKLYKKYSNGVKNN